MRREGLRRISPSSRAIARLRRPRPIIRKLKVVDLADDHPPTANTSVPKCTSASRSAGMADGGSRHANTANLRPTGPLEHKRKGHILSASNRTSVVRTHAPLSVRQPDVAAQESGTLEGQGKAAVSNMTDGFAVIRAKQIHSRSGDRGTTS
jgi:hypothetical protein